MTGPVDFPLAVDRRGATARTGRSEHIRDLVEQVLFTAPGERVNRPGFGAGVAQLLFGAATPEVAATAQMLVQGALQQWLGDLIEVLAVEAVQEESTMTVVVSYTERLSGSARSARFEQPGAAS